MADLEDRLRRSLQARATDVRPDPATWNRVSERIRRERTVRFVVAGLGLAGLLAVAAVTLPTLLNARVEFTPAPLATQPPAASEEPAPSGRAVCGGDVLVAVFATTDGRLEASCGGGSVETIFDGEGLESAPTISPDGTKLLFERRLDGGDGTATLVMADLLTGARTERGEGYGPAFGPDGRYAFFRDAPADGRQPEVVVPIGEELFTVPVAGTDVPQLTASDLSWDPSGDRLYWSAGYEGAALWALDVSGDEPGSPQRIGVIGVDSGALLAPASSAPDALAVIHQCCVAVEGELPTGAALGRVELTGQPGEGGTLEASYGVILDFLDVEGFSAAGPFDVAGAGTADAVGAGPGGSIRWVTGETATWIVVSDGTAWLVSGDGAVMRLRDGVAAAAANPAGTAGASPPDPTPPSEQPTAPPVEATEPAAPATTEVQVYFGASGQQETGDCAFARAYPRRVETPGVARGALTELLAGPTQAEVDAGAFSFFSNATAGSLNSVRIIDGTAEVDFADFREALSGATSSCGSTQLLSELDNTLLQFPSIERTRYSLEGDVEAFYAWLQRSVPGDEPQLPGPTAQMRDRVRDAARFAVQSGDLAEIESLIPEDDFFCGDGPGACVDRWRGAGGDVSEAMGALVEALGRGPARSDARPDLWVWPAGFPVDGSAPGPGVVISDDGVWRQYVAPD